MPRVNPPWDPPPALRSASAPKKRKKDTLTAVATERARIRRELEAVVKEWAASRETASLHEPGKIFAEHLRAALDRICPEET